MDRVNELSHTIIGAALGVHQKYGPGLFETVYEKLLEHSLKRAGLKVRCQKTFPLTAEGIVFPKAFRPDMIVEDAVIIEVKAVEAISPVHCRQLLTYLKLLDYRLGLVLNFDAALLKDGIERVVNRL